MKFYENVEFYMLYMLLHVLGTHIKIQTFFRTLELKCFSSHVI